MMDDFRFVRCPNCGWGKNPRKPCFNCGDKVPAKSTASSDAELTAAKARIAELENALGPLADLSHAWSEHDSDMDEKLVLVQCGDARRAAALLKRQGSVRTDDSYSIGRQG